MEGVERGRSVPPSALRSGTTMSSSLPPEILDHVVDHLHDEPDTLKACCVTSKSWVSRTRTHLFSRIEFLKSTFQSWMKAFPDPSNSPAHYTRSLTIYENCLVVATSRDSHAWIRAFHNVVHLALDNSWWSVVHGCLIPLHGLSPALRSLSITCWSISPSEALKLVCSCPSLEDFTLIPRIIVESDGWAIPSTSPKLTGTLYLLTPRSDGIRPFIRYLLDLPDGLRFSKISVNYLNEEAELALDLVSSCFDTLKSLCLLSPVLCAFRVSFRG